MSINSSWAFFSFTKLSSSVVRRKKSYEAFRCTFNGKYLSFFLKKRLKRFHICICLWCRWMQAKIQCNLIKNLCDIMRKFNKLRPHINMLHIAYFIRQLNETSCPSASIIHQVKHIHSAYSSFFSLLRSKKGQSLSFSRKLARSFRTCRLVLHSYSHVFAFQSPTTIWFGGLTRKLENL